MKRFLVVLTLVLGLTLTGCATTDTGNTPVGNEPSFRTVSDIKVYLGDDVDLFYGVLASDIEDGTITNSIVITNSDDLPLDGMTTTQVGAFTIIYSVTDSDNNTTTMERDLIISDPSTVVEQTDCDVTKEGYTLTFCDAFGVAENANAQGIDMDKWDYQNGDGSQFGIPGWGNNEQQYYRQENSFVDNGALYIEAKHETYGGLPYTSSKLVTLDKFSQTYGYFEARISLPIGDGFWPAFWMLPEDSVYGGWAASGEIDIMEAKGRFPSASSGAIHYGGAWPNNTYQHGENVFTNGETIEDFHVYAVEWTDSSIKWFVDDELVWQTNSWYTEGHDFPAPFNQDFFIILNLAIGGTFDGGRVPANSVFDNPVYMIVDYVRVYQDNDNLN